MGTSLLQIGESITNWASLLQISICIENQGNYNRSNKDESEPLNHFFRILVQKKNFEYLSLICITQKLCKEN